MKKSLVSIILIIALLSITGCLDYKAYDVPEEETSSEETSLVDEIAQIEEELGFEDEPEEELEPEVVEEEIVLPELEEEPIVEEISETNLRVINVKENELIKLKVDVTDPDKDRVTYSFTKPLNKEGQWKTNYGDAGEYLVTLSATDGRLTTKEEIKIVVARVNVPPVITGVKDITVKEGALIEFEPKVSDPNNDPVNIEVTEPLKSGSFQTDHTSAGEYRINVVASDGELESEDSFTLTINDVNVLPEISGLKNRIIIKEGETVEIKPKISDLDEDAITLTISEPVGNDGVWETAYTDHGEYIITVVADDSKDKVTKKITLTVEDVNKAPEIVDVSLMSN